MGKPVDDADSWMKTLPKKGEPYEHVWNNMKQKWCGKCMYWMLPHTMVEHQEAPPTMAKVGMKPSGSASFSYLTMCGF